MSFGRRPDERGRPIHQPLEHKTGFGQVTGVRLAGPGLDSPSEVGRAVAGLGLVALADAPEHLAEVTFDGGKQLRVEDFRPVLPLLFRW
jgi:hypothetical protein